jgi:hypothetical protein
MRRPAVSNESDLVRKLYFGRDDAERDMADGLLRNGFLPTRAYEEALTGRKSLVIGRKGAGKSAICMQLAAQGKSSGRTALITPDVAAGEELRRFELQGLTLQAAKSLIWRYVFAIQAARYLVEHAKKDHGKKLPSIRAVDRFLRQNKGNFGDRFYDRVLSGVTGLQASFSLEAFGVKAGMDVKGQSEGAKADRQLEVIEHGVARAFADLDCAQRHEPLVILVDQIEMVWSGDPESNAMVRGLLLAGQHVAGPTYGGALRCVLFIRSDIYDSLVFGEGDKFHGDEMRIDWTPEELGEVALARARASLEMPTLSADALWTEIFPAEVNGERVPDYLLSRALPRPRDVIQFLNLCRDGAANRRRSQITVQDLIDATQQFSEWKLQDLTREYLVNYPFLPQLFVMFQNTGYVVMRAALANRLAEYGEMLRNQFSAYANIFIPQGVVDILYGIGFLGVKRGGNVIYTWQNQAGIQPVENEFHIHPCFRPALNAVTATGIYMYNVEAARGAYAAGANILSVAAGRDVAVGYSREAALLQSLVGTCERILRQLGRSGLPEDVRAQVSEALGQVMSGAAEQRQKLRAGEAGHPIEHVITAAGYLDRLADKLAQNGIAESAAGQQLVRRIDDESKRLIREAGGEYTETLTPETMAPEDF